MTEAELIEAVKAIAESLRSDLSANIAKLDEKCTALADSVAKMKSDAAGATKGAGARKMDNDDEGVADPTAARRTAADSIDPAAFAALRSEVAALKKTRPTADLNAFGDVQAKADQVLRTHNERADPPMHGEDLVSYKIRTHRAMQKHSAKWKSVELNLIKADQQALDNVCTEIRADALQAGLNPVGLPLFQHREIVQESPGGHKIRSFVGNGTIFKQMSRPVRHVAFIGTRSSAAHY